jgi:hypothetical protein
MVIIHKLIQILILKQIINLSNLKQIKIIFSNLIINDAQPFTNLLTIKIFMRFYNFQ